MAQQPDVDLATLLSEEEADNVLGCARAIYCIVSALAHPSYPHAPFMERQPVQALEWLVTLQDRQMAALERRMSEES